MLEEFIEYINSQQLISIHERILVGVSGGKDSVVLVDLLAKAGYTFSLAHCNFHLRGEESDGEEAFVAELAKKYGQCFYSISFNTKEIATERGISIEMAARDLRYRWFEDLLRKHNYYWIAIAHHRDDQLETFFLNLSRGTGISGLTGIKQKHGKVIRPLLFASRKEIEHYCAENDLDFREDSSNCQLDYQRNKIRHLILPLMEELNPSFREGLSETIDHLRETSSIFHQKIAEVQRHVFHYKKGGEVEISIPELKKLCPLSTYLFEFLHPYNFNKEVIAEILQALSNSSTGKQFFSFSHRAVINRDTLLVQELAEEPCPKYYLEEGVALLNQPVRLTISCQIRAKNSSINTSSKVAMIDQAKLQFPLVIRKWQKGDVFQPLGMNGMKKLSNYFIDEKFSLIDKEKCWILANGEEIVWIIGYRLDDRYKVTSDTKDLVVITLG